jgi:hypothetical protein
LDTKKSPSTKVTVEDLFHRYGIPVEDRVLADWLDLDVRTIRKYVRSLGGREIIPGVFLFTIEGLDEVILGSNSPAPVARPTNPTASEPQKERSIQNQSGTPSPVIGHLKGKGGNGKLRVDRHGLWTGTANNKPSTKSKNVEEPVCFEEDVSKYPQEIG